MRRRAGCWPTCGTKLTGIDLVWTETDDSADEPLLDYAAYNNLVSTHRELVSNAIRHACARRVEITVTREDAGLRRVFADDGVGFGNRTENGKGSGLINLRQRVAALDGRLVVGASEHGGARVELTLPQGSGAVMTARQ